jgi:glycosyltransferase involved in cell wall biosynthesis
MKILIASYYPLPVLGGGIWTFVSQLQKRLERLGHSVDILIHNIDATELLAENRNFSFHKSLLILMQN